MCDACRAAYTLNLLFWHGGPAVGTVVSHLLLPLFVFAGSHCISVDFLQSKDVRFGRLASLNYSYDVILCLWPATVNWSPIQGGCART